MFRFQARFQLDLDVRSRSILGVSVTFATQSGKRDFRLSKSVTFWVADERFADAKAGRSIQVFRFEKRVRDFDADFRHARDKVAVLFEV